MSGQLISKPGKNDTYDKTPEPPFHYKNIGIVPVILVVMALIIAIVIGQAQSTALAIIVSALFFVYFAYTPISKRLCKRWFAKWRWYAASIDKVKTESTMSNYELMFRGQSAPGLVVLRMSNRHVLEFNDRPPFDITDSQSGLLYEARHVNGKLEFRNVQPLAG